MDLQIDSIRDFQPLPKIVNPELIEPSDRSMIRSLSIKKAQTPYIIGPLGPKASKYESFEGKGVAFGP